MSPTLEKHEVDPIRAVLDREYESEPFGVVRLYKLVEKVFQFSDIYGAIFLLKKKSGSDPMLFGIVSVLPPYKTLFLHYSITLIFNCWLSSYLFFIHFTIMPCSWQFMKKWK